jgi:hypothetical protein
VHFVELLLCRVKQCVLATSCFERIYSGILELGAAGWAAPGVLLHLVNVHLVCKSCFVVDNVLEDFLLTCGFGLDSRPGFLIELRSGYCWR